MGLRGLRDPARSRRWTTTRRARRSTRPCGEGTSIIFVTEDVYEACSEQIASTGTRPFRRSRCFRASRARAGSRPPRYTRPCRPRSARTSSETRARADGQLTAVSASTARCQRQENDAWQRQGFRGPSGRCRVRSSSPTACARRRCSTSSSSATRTSSARSSRSRATSRRSRSTRTRADSGPGSRSSRLGEPLSVELGPGLIESIYDGIQRPLDKIREMAGASSRAASHVPGLDREKKWEFVATAKVGDDVVGGDILGTVHGVDAGRAQGHGAADVSGQAHEARRAAATPSRTSIGELDDRRRAQSTSS